MGINFCEQLLGQKLSFVSINFHKWSKFWRNYLLSVPFLANLSLIFCEWPRKYNFACINFHGRPKKSQNRESLPAKVSTFKVVKVQCWQLFTVPYLTTKSGKSCFFIKKATQIWPYFRKSRPNWKNTKIFLGTIVVVNKLIDNKMYNQK